MSDGYGRFGADNEYARRVGIAGPGLITTFALQNRSVSVRNVLARAATGGRFDADTLMVLVKTFQRTPKEARTRAFMKEVKPAPLLALAKVLWNQSASPLDAYDAVTLYKAVIGHHGVKALRWDDRLIFLEVLAAKGWVNDLRKYLRVLGMEQRDRTQSELLEANATNPFRTGVEDASDVRVQVWLEMVNRTLAKDGVEPIGIAPGDEPPIDRILCAASSFVEDGPQVTVIVPTYDPGPRIETAIESLLGQSYRNLQILVMDDASPEESARALDVWQERDPRITVVHLTQNAGTYRARNIAVSQYATGEYITVHDDDDWSHPRKIEFQVRHLEENPEDLANVSMLSRTTEKLLFARINNNAIFTQKNYSSMMLRRSVFDDLGYWDVVNRSADAEMFDRIVAVTGRPIQAAGTVPLSFLRIREASLTSGEIHKGYIDARRVWYQRVSRAWHAERLAAGERPYVGLEYPPVRPFAAPVGMVGSKQAHVVHEFDVVYATDFRFPGGNSSLTTRELEVLVDRGYRVALLQLDSPLLGPQTPLNAGVLRLLGSGQVSIISLLDHVRTRLTIVRHPTVLQYIAPERSSVNTEHLVIIFNHAPFESDQTGAVYDVSDVVNNGYHVFGTAPELAPESGLVRSLMRGLADPVLHTPFNWEGIVVDARTEHRTVDETRPAAIGRHARDADLKWPDISLLDQVYPTDGTVDVRILGGAECAAKKYNRSLSAWTIYPFGSKPVAEFLDEVDFWIYFHSNELHESFGMATAEAMAAGLVVILPPYMEATFGEGAIYCDPADVQALVRKLWMDPEAYSAQSKRALNIAKQRFGSDAFEGRISRYLQSRA